MMHKWAQGTREEMLVLNSELEIDGSAITNP